MLLDVTRNKEDQEEFLETASRLSDECFAPMAMGGKIKNVEQAQRLFRDYGADKISINTAAIDDPDLISRMADKFGSQSVVLSIDVEDGEVVTDCGRRPTGRDALEWAEEGIERGAGEILLMSIPKDGSLMGYDLELCKRVSKVNVPTLIHGGAGSWKHFVDGINAGASGVCTQNIYHFTESSIQAAKTFMSENGVPTRL